jgi:aminoglycoside phosphotransferase (APT) family kinase protein
LEVGDALGMAYAISERHRGRFLEDVEPDEVDRAGPALMRLLTALRENRAPADSPAAWEPGASPRSTWRSWLTDALRDDPGRRVSGWRATLAADPALDTLHRACEARIDGLLEACPERRDLVHGDLLHGNVLIAEDASQVTAVFSWKCSVRGDFLFDTAWCTFWGGWHPGIAAVDAWSRTLKSAPPADLVDAPVRHHCYELQIGASHLGWNAWTGNTDELRRTAARTAEVLERGPRPA